MCTQNVRFWDDVNPFRTYETKLNAAGLMVLSAVSTRGSLLYFFDSIDIPAVYKPSKQTIRKNGYRTMPANAATFLYLMKDRIVKDLQDLFPDVDLSDVVPCFDGASIHRERHVTEFMNQNFKMWFGYNSVNRYPSNSPDLMPLDFSYFHKLRCSVFRSGPPSTLRQLRQRITDVVHSFDIFYLQKLILDGFLHRLLLCKENSGKQFELWQ